jgi:hypothetical protein
MLPNPASAYDGPVPAYLSQPEPLDRQAAALAAHAERLAWAVRAVLGDPAELAAVRKELEAAEANVRRLRARSRQDFDRAIQILDALNRADPAIDMAGDIVRDELWRIASAERGHALSREERDLRDTVQAFNLDGGEAA